MSEDRKCPDCNGEVCEIRLIDSGHAGIHYPTEYAAAESKRTWTGNYPVEGQVAAFMCQQCGRIRLYGVPKN